MLESVHTHTHTPTHTHTRTQAHTHTPTPTHVGLGCGLLLLTPDDLERAVGLYADSQGLGQRPQGETAFTTP